ncbi:MAG TPA: hypothetical protein VHY79_10280 [Rhizomicrobium sp.]|jgi:hypothetical protein|nr:hypothetical protein [Rhizomicrobium sp.]
MRFTHAAIAAFLLGGAAGWFWPARAQQSQQPMSDQQMQAMPHQHMPMDTPVPIGGAQAVCTGVGQGAEDDPRWTSFPIRLVFSNKGAQYLSGAHVDLSTANGKALGSLDCDGPWVLLGLSPGTYRVSATLLSQPGGSTASATFTTPSSGQKRVDLQFPLAQNQ